MLRNYQMLRSVAGHVYQQTIGKIVAFAKYGTTTMCVISAPIEARWGHLEGMVAPYEAILETLGGMLASEDPMWPWRQLGASL